MLQSNRRWLLIAALVLVSLFTLNFAARAFQHARILHQRPARPDEPIQSWMNIPYIAHAYHVPPPVVAGAIGLSPDRRDPRPLREIAAEQGRTPDALIADILAAIKQERAQHEPPRPLSPPPAPPTPTASSGTQTP